MILELGSERIPQLPRPLSQSLATVKVEALWHQARLSQLLELFVSLNELLASLAK